MLALDSEDHADSAAEHVILDHPWSDMIYCKMEMYKRNFLDGRGAEGNAPLETLVEDLVWVLGWVINL